MPPVLPPNSWIDQPTTQAGTVRTRVFVACQACRSRKIKCDGIKPVCTNCIKKDFAPGPTFQHLLPPNERYKLNNGICCYDDLPKRRGPDRLPGARVRKKTRGDDSGHERVSRRRATVDDGAPGHPRRSRSPTELADASDASRGMQYDGAQNLYYANDPSATNWLSEHPQRYHEISSVDPGAVENFQPSNRISHQERRRTLPQLDIGHMSPPASSSSSDSLRSPQRLSSATHDRRRTARSSENPTQTAYRLPRPPIGDGFAAPPTRESISPSSESPVARIAKVRRDSWRPTDAIAPATGHSASSYPAINPSYEYVPSSGAYIQTLDDSSDPDEHYRRSTDELAFQLPMVPGSSFVQKTWYDSLLDTYASLSTNPSSAPFYQAGSLTLTSEDRTTAHTAIVSDLRHLFARSSWWFSFIHVPSFWANFHSPEKRTSSDLQPGLLLSALAMAVFFKSSEAEGGAWSRERATRLKAEAEAAVESSLAVGWVDVGLAQAAWLLAMYEVNPHPYHSLQKTRSALARLDNIIRLLKCTSVDADSPVVTRFDARATVVSPRQITTPAVTHTTASHHHQNGYFINDVDRSSGIYPYGSSARGDSATSPVSIVRWPSSTATVHNGLSDAGAIAHTPIHQQHTECKCHDITLGNNVPESKTHTPLWQYTPSWIREHEPGEIRREETRRIVWAFVTLASSVAGHTATLGTTKSTDIYWSASAENLSVLFPGEAAMYYDQPSEPSSHVKESVWALYARAQLLWLACLRVRHLPSVATDAYGYGTQGDLSATSLYSGSNTRDGRGGAISESEIADFAMKAWLQTREIEKALDAHTCNLERAYMFHGREYLSSIRMIMTQEFSRYVPFPNTGTDPQFNRLQADDWLKHQSAVCQRMMMGLRHVTGHQLNVLSDRPYFVWWFMIQIVRLLNLWSCDQSMKDAVELCFAFLPAIDYLTSLWPSENQRNKYLSLRQRLDDACHQTGLPLPPPPNLGVLQ